MAKDDENADLDLGEEKPSKKKLLIIIAIVVLLLIGGGVAAYFLLSNDEAADDQAEAEDETAESTEEQGPALYHKMDPVFIVNLPGHPSLLQVGVSLRVNDDQMIEFLQHNDPMLRHHLLNLLQNQEAKSLISRDAKEALQSEMLAEINRIAQELSGPGTVDALYFTSFVMQ